MTTELSWESGPLRLLVFPTPSTPEVTDLIILHNALIRAINSIYIQAPQIPLAEYNNFVAYCLATYQGLLALDNILTKSKGAGCHDDSVKAWGHWIQSISAHKNNFSPEMCVGLMDDFMPSLQTQFETQSADQAARESSKMRSAERDRVLGGMSKTTLLPVLLMNHDEAFGGGRSRFPGTKGVGMMVARAGARKNAEWWKFSTVGGGGKREIRYVKGGVR
jgi:hypothetical protein